MQILIRHRFRNFTVCLQNLLLMKKKKRKKTSNTPKIGNGLLQFLINRIITKPNVRPQTQTISKNNETITKASKTSQRIFFAFEQTVATVLKQSKKEGKDQASILSSTTPDQGYQWESYNFTIRRHKREPRGQVGDHKASPKHYFRDVFRVHISSEDQPVCNNLLP